jgi:hypothetical protein
MAIATLRCVYSVVSNTDSYYSVFFLGLDHVGSDSGAENFFCDKDLEKNVRDAERCGRNIYQEFITMPASLTCSAHLSRAIFTADTMERN